MQFSENELNKLCDFWQVGEIISPPKTIKSDRLWRLTTCKGVFALKRVSAYNQVNQGERIARKLQLHKLPVIAAMTHQKDVICHVNGKGYLLSPWQNGEILPLTAAPPQQAYLIGKLLAEIHKVNLQLSGIALSAWQKLEMTDWQHWIKDAAWPAELTERLKVMLPKLVQWTENYCAASEKLSIQPWVITHGDLTQSNIIWENELAPKIIDWEAAGWAHPQVELLGAALNWSGINYDMPSHASFTAVIKGYQSIKGLVQINETVLQTGLGSWLAWLAYAIQNFLKENQSDWIKEINQTLNVLERFANLSNVLI